MASRLIIPFDFNPDSNIAVTGAGYTVPAGKYAYTRLHAGNGNILVNGSAIFYNNQINTYGSGTSTSTSTSELTLITVGAGVGGKMSWAVSVTDSATNVIHTFRHRRGGVELSRFSFGSAGGSNSRIVFVLPSDTFTSQQNAGVVETKTASITGVYDLENRDYEMWLKSGDVLTFSNSYPVAVTGLITLYNSIS